MSEALRKLTRVLPDWPRRKDTIFCGSTSWREWWVAWWYLLAGGGGLEAIRNFESEAARRTGCRYAVSFGAGRMGLYATLEALGLQPGDEIILPAFTCAVVPNAIVYRELRPIYVDIDPVTFNIDPDQAAAAITPRTRAIYAQHTFGVSCRIGALRELADRHGLALIEDAAHSLGAKCDGRPHGSLGDVAYVSTDRTKVINTHLGGFVVTSDADLASRLYAAQDRACKLGLLDSRKLVFSFLAEFFLRLPDVFWIGRPVLGALRRTGLMFYWTDEQMDALPAGYPYPCRFTPAQGRLGIRQLGALDDNIAHRVRIAQWLEQRVGWYGQSIPGRFEDQAWLRYSFLVHDRDGFVRRFGKHIDLGIWFTCVIFGREGRLQAVGYRPGSCPKAEMAAGHIVNLPTHPRISLKLIQSLWSRYGEWVQSQVMRTPPGRSGTPGAPT